MTKQQKITLSASRDIPFNKLMLSQSNVRHVKAGVSIEELAEDISRRTLLSSITVRPTATACRATRRHGARPRSSTTGGVSMSSSHPASPRAKCPRSS